MAIIAKIEKPEALEEIESILEASDGIMVARGDLGVELPAELVPIAQSQLVNLARVQGKPVIVATQMLESMIESSRPTRAEVTDVAHAVESGADAVMLSAETAVGADPVEAVSVMDRIARETESYMWSRGAFGNLGPATLRVHERGDQEQERLEDSVARATAQLSRDLMVRAIVVFTSQGRSARMVSAGRPQSPVVAASRNVATYRRAALLWGVMPLQLETEHSEDLHEVARNIARDAGLAQPGDYILRVWGFHWSAERSAPTMSILRV